MVAASKRVTAKAALRTVVVDDSALARLMLRDALTGIDGVRVVGNAADGNAALEVIDEVQPGLIILDVEMPGMNGLDMLKQMALRGLETPVLMCSRLTSVGAEVTTEALLQGAYDFVCKPSGGSRKENVASLRDEIARRIGPLIEGARGKVEVIRTSTTVPPNSLANVDIKAVFIGASTGGPAALHTLLGRLDPRINVPILVVQHIPVGFSEPLARRLAHECQLPVVEASDGEMVVGGRVYLARGGNHLMLQDSPEGPRIRLGDCPPLNGCRPSVDVLLGSAMKHYGRHSLVVILTGMGKDGAIGAREIRGAGGIVFTQHPDTCTVSSMPRQAIGTAGADRVADLAQLSELINSLAIKS